MSPTKYIETMHEGRILHLLINNPPHNHLPSGFFKDLHACLDLMRSADVDAVIFSGKGKVFSKGADLAELDSKTSKLDIELVNFGNKIFTHISNLKKPVIAAINGACLGGGLELALACHIRLSSAKARLGLPELSIGLIPGLGGIERLIRVVGEARALEMILLGDIISASRAMEINLVSRVFPKDDFSSRVTLFVKTLLHTRKAAIDEVFNLFALSRSEKEDNNISRAAQSFVHLLTLKQKGGIEK